MKRKTRRREKGGGGRPFGLCDGEPGFLRRAKAEDLQNGSVLRYIGEQRIVLRLAMQSTDAAPQPHRELPEVRLLVTFYIGHRRTLEGGCAEGQRPSIIKTRGSNRRVLASTSRVPVRCFRTEIGGHTEWREWRQ